MDNLRNISDNVTQQMRLKCHVCLFILKYINLKLDRNTKDDGKDEGKELYRHNNFVQIKTFRCYICYHG